MNKIRVLIVEDSTVVRRFLEHLIQSDPRLEVAASVGTAEEALNILHRVSPDVITMDIRLPGMNGFEATQRIMSLKPTPIVVVSASVEAEDLKISMNALRAGALAVVEKPVGMNHEDYQLLAQRLCSQLVNMSQVKVIRQRIDRGLRFGPPKETRSPQILGQALAQGPGPFRMLGIVTSTGGPQALTAVLGSLPKNFPLPILVVQHITDSFLDGFVTWLNSVLPLPVQLAQDREVPQAGHIYLPPADRHLRVEGGLLRWDRSPPVCSQRPSGTILFQSMARSLGPTGLGVLLTGMGEDGAEGLQALREAGGYTLAEDASTAVVYGMPAAAVRLGAVCESLPLHEIAPQILALTAMRK